MSGLGYAGSAGDAQQQQHQLRPQQPPPLFMMLPSGEMVPVSLAQGPASSGRGAVGPGDKLPPKRWLGPKRSNVESKIKRMVEQDRDAAQVRHVLHSLQHAYIAVLQYTHHTLQYSIQNSFVTHVAVSSMGPVSLLGAVPEARSDVRGHWEGQGCSAQHASAASCFRT